MWTCMQSSFSEVPLGSVEVTIKAAVPLTVHRSLEGHALSVLASGWMVRAVSTE